MMDLVVLLLALIGICRIADILIEALDELERLLLAEIRKRKNKEDEEDDR